MINNNGFDYIDLDLPSGTLWATCNVGASRPYENELYFQWGDTKGYIVDQVEKYKRFSWDDYKFSINGSNKNFSKYTNLGKTLNLKDDAAHNHMGGDWHIPSPEQIKELLDNTISRWIELDYIKGRLFMSKKDERKHIFIPAAGFVQNGSVCCRGSYGNVWSSMLDMYDVNYGQYLVLGSGFACPYYDDRCCGFSVRGVIDGKCDDDIDIIKIEDNQKVYIKGSSDRGDEVIKILTNLGGINPNNLDGKSEDFYYYISSISKKINRVKYNNDVVMSVLKEESYKEIKLSKK